MSKYLGFSLAITLVHLLSISACCETRCEPEICYSRNALHPIDPENPTDNEVFEKFDIKLLELSTSTFTTTTTTTSGGVTITLTITTTTEVPLFLDPYLTISESNCPGCEKQAVYLQVNPLVSTATDSASTVVIGFHRYPSTSTTQCPVVDIYSVFGNWSPTAGVVALPVIFPQDTAAFVLVFPPFFDFTDLLIYFTFNGIASSATYVPDIANYDATLTSDVFTSLFTTTILASDGTFVNYQTKSNITLTLCELYERIKKDRYCGSVDNECLDYIAFSNVCDESRLVVCRTVCREKKECVPIKSCFMRYAAFVTCSLKTCVSFESAGSCANIFATVNNSCSDKFNACNAAMSYICNKTDCTQSVSICIYTMFNNIIGLNPYCNMGFRESSLLYGLSKEDRMSMEGICDTKEDELSEMIEKSEEKVTKMKKRAATPSKKSVQKTSFMAKFNWAIAGSCTVVIMAVAVYIFVM